MWLSFLLSTFVSLSTLLAGITVSPTGALASPLSPRSVAGLTAPINYAYAWNIDNYRLTMIAGEASAYTYISRFTVSRTARTVTQVNVQTCTARCDATVNCAMAYLVLFQAGSNKEGNLVCALYNTPTTPYWAQNRQDGDSSMGSVDSSYAFTKVFDSWVWNTVPGTMCSEGSQTGFALNQHHGSTDVVVIFQDGGVCGSYAQCYQQGKAFNMGVPYTGDTFANQGIGRGLDYYYALTMRGSSSNPFQGANFAWIPYCTGDLHAGDASVVYPPNTKPTRHHGFKNGQLMLQAIKTALPFTQRVWITGSSAGGFGAIYQYPNAVRTFGSDKRIDLIADSAENAGSVYFYPSLNIQVASQSQCPMCDSSNFDSFLSKGYPAVRANSRFAAISFQNDTVLPSYENVTYDNLMKEITATFTALNGNFNGKAFLMQGSGHVALSSPNTPAVNGRSIYSFLTDMVDMSKSFTVGM